MAYFTDLKQLFQKFVWNPKRSLIASTILRRKNKFGDIIISDIKIYYKAIVIKQPGTDIRISVYINVTEQKSQK